MIKIKSSLIAPSLALLLCTNIYAAETYSLNSMSLKDALQEVAKISKLSYFADESLIQGKKAPSIKDIDGTQNALNKLLKDTKLKAVIQNGTIIIKKDETKNEEFSAVLPTIYVEAMEEDDRTKGYVGYEDASLLRNHLSIKETPHTIDTLNIQRNKNYGTNDLSSILEGNAGVDSVQDARADNVYIRGFRADVNDIYRDGIREGGQVKRSTANIERVEILKGPASLLFGRSTGGGIINMVSKYANFKDANSFGLSYGSFEQRGVNIDVNKAINDNVAVRIVGDVTKGSTFRDGLQEEINQETKMFSPSVTVTDNDRITWTGQYTYDNSYGTQDRGPEKSVYDEMGISYDKAFTHNGDFREDDLDVFRSTLNYQLNNKWDITWDLAYREASQNFQNFYNGSFDESTQLLTQNYSWQATENKTLSNNITLNGEFKTGNIVHKITTGLDYSKEERNAKLHYSSSETQTFDPYDSSSWENDVFDNELTSHDVHKLTSSGIFINDVLEFTDDVKLVLGLRYDRYKFHSENVLDGDLGEGDTTTYNGHSWSPQIGLVYNINNAHTVYASYNKSFVPQGATSYLTVNTDTESSDLNTEPQRNEQYELGLKSDWLDGKLSSTFSLFHIQHFNIRYQPDSTNEPDVWETRGQERSVGGEFSLIGQLVDDVYFRTSLGIKRATVVEDKKNPQYEGNFLSNTSRISGNIFVRYSPSADNYYIEGGVTHIGTRDYYSDRSGVKGVLGAFNRVDALVGYKFEDFNLTLGVLNVLDKEYWRSSRMPGASRSFTARLNYKF